MVLQGGDLKHEKDPSAALLLRIQEAKGGRSAAASILESELEEFIKSNDVDERAAADLRECNPAMQRAVIARGDLRTARNPSSAVLARIRDARMGIQGRGPDSGSSHASMGSSHAYPPA